MNLRVRKLGAVIVGLYCGSCAYATSLQKYPGSETPLYSPNRALSILNVDRDQAPNHSLFLRDETTGATRKVLDYGRHVDVMWSTDSQSFFVNDYSGSTESDCEVFSAADLNPIDVLEALKSADRALPPSDHRYITCNTWHGHLVLVSVSGRSDDKHRTIEQRYSVDTRTGKARALQ
jgi:hypothetical protein